MELHLIHRCCEADRAFFPAGEKAFLKISVDSALAPRVQFVRNAIAFVAVDDEPSRVYSFFLSSLTVLPLSFHTLFVSASFFASCLYISTFNFICNSPHYVSVGFFQASKDQSEALRGPKINSLLPSRWPFLVYFARIVILLSSSAVLLQLFTLASIIPAAK